jgi:[ribosomal protein S18]-alanine N-acetyltransferase
VSELAKQGYLLKRSVSKEQAFDFFNDFDAAELKLQGWSVSLLLETLLKNQGFYFIDETGAIISLILDQELGSNHREVLFLATAPKHRKKGALAALLTNYLQLPENERVWLECRVDNIAALGLYKKCGFHQCGRRSKYYNDGMDAILMEFRGFGVSP